MICSRIGHRCKSLPATKWSRFAAQH